ncbi:hypothetical protein [Streptomyces sp. SM12]|uniref:hypothetical protein n=1 Tax=Streptomyces sp. SM12 TaxID=1071602 RepID=UPI000CD543E0|nr:hypothetical protein [Streptomyces sp. SM12]
MSRLVSPDATVHELASALKTSAAGAGVFGKISVHSEKDEFLFRLDRVGAAALTRAMRAATRVSQQSPQMEALVWCRRARRVGIVRGTRDGMVQLEAYVDGNTFRSPAARLTPVTLPQMRAAAMFRARHQNSPQS